MLENKHAKVSDNFEELFGSCLKNRPKPTPLSKKTSIVQGNQFSLATIGKVFAKFVGKNDVLTPSDNIAEFDFLDPIKEQVKAIIEVFEAHSDEIMDNADDPELEAGTIKKILSLTYPVKTIEKAITHAIDKAENYVFSGFNLKNANQLLDELILDLDDPRQTMLKTGFDLWDYKLNGGLCESGLHILAAPSSRGKSALGLQVATSAAKQGKKVLYFSLEMSNRQNICRILSAFDENINSSNILSKSVTNEDKQAIRKAKGAIKNLNLFFSQSQNINYIVKDIKDNLALMKEIDLIVIDYIQLIECDTRGQTNTEVRVATATKKLKNLALKHNLRILALAQMNEKDGEKLGSGNLRSSAAIGHFAETVTFICHKDCEQIKGDDGNLINIHPRTWLQVAKNRNGGPRMAPEITMDHKYFFTRGLFRQEQSLSEKLDEEKRNQSAVTKKEEKTNTKIGCSEGSIPEFTFFD